MTQYKLSFKIIEGQNGVRFSIFILIIHYRIIVNSCFTTTTTTSDTERCNLRFFTIFSLHCLAGQVVMVSALRAEDLGFESRLRRDFFGSSHTSDFKIGTPVATLPGAWHYRVSAGTGQPGVSIL